MTRLVDRATDKAFLRYRAKRQVLWDKSATDPPSGDMSGYYHKRLVELYRFAVPDGMKVLEIGCGNGDLLAALNPARGLGIDFSPAMVELASIRNPELEIRCVDAHDFETQETFDVIILSDLIHDLYDVQAVLDRVAQASRPDTRIIINFYSRLWQAPLALTRFLGLAKPLFQQNWLSLQDVSNLLHLSGMEIVSSSEEVLMPIKIPLLSQLMNKVIVKLWPFRYFALSRLVVARPANAELNGTDGREPSVSVIVPARNEAGHIQDILDRTPPMGAHTELIFVEGNSTDDTFDVIKRALEERDDPSLYLYRQPGVGKGDAVRYGYSKATGDILMILDADMTVAPEDLPRFYRAIRDGSGEFINGVRLVYPMESQAMRFLNYLGNRFFGAVFSWLLKQPVKDTLCGTKVLTRSAYDVIAANRSYFGDFDPFGDFDLLFGAAKNNLKMVDMPIRYREREYGTTNIDRWSHGVLLLRMAAYAARKLRFV